MCRSLTLFLFLRTTLLLGCLSAPLAAESGSQPIPELTKIESADLPIGVIFFALSEDGNTFIAGIDYSVGLYSTSDYTPMEKHYERKDEPSATMENTTSLGMRANIYDLGYIDANTWYFVGRTLIENDIRVHVRTIHPPQEVSASIIDEISYNAFVSSNKNYIASSNGLIDWRTGKYYPAKIRVLEPKWHIVPTLTPDNRIITYPKQKTVIFDPLNDTIEVWKDATSIGNSIVVTPDNHHVIGLSTANYKCTLWRWPERKEIGHCSKRLRGIFGKYPEYLEVLALSPDGKRFAIGVENNVRVYRIEPFQLELEASTPGRLVALALSDDGWLAGYDDKGSLRVWNIGTSSLVGQYDFPSVGWDANSGYKLAFQPNSNKLFLKRSAIEVFEIPKQTTQQKPEAIPGRKLDNPM